jgi:hypothetical protein
MIVLGSLLIARGDPPTLFETINQAFHGIAQSVEDPIKGSCSCITAFVGDGEPDPMSPQVLSDGPTAIALIPDQSGRAVFWAPGARSFDRPVFHEGHKDSRFMALAGGQEKGHGLPIPLGPQMDFRAEAPLAAP